MNYSFILPINNNNDNNINFIHKKKFFVKEDPSKNVPGHYKLDQQKCSLINDESQLLQSTVNRRDKTQMVLKKCFNPSDYNIPYTDNYQSFDAKEISVIDKIGTTAPNLGPGRGFGNLLISNEIRYGDASRNNTKQLREHQEGLQTFDYKFQYLDKNFQDPKHIVMSMPRGGIQTRKQNSDYNTFTKKLDMSIIDFKY